MLWWKGARSAREQKVVTGIARAVYFYGVVDRPTGCAAVGTTTGYRNSKTFGTITEEKVYKR